MTTYSDAEQRRLDQASGAAMDWRTSYEKVKPGEPLHDFIRANRGVERWVCDSADHNSPTGCSNPACFKHKGERVKLIVG